jgi:trimeric autotransporter adhesin
MARRLSGGLTGSPSVGALNIAPTAVVSAATDQDITLDPAGTGRVLIAGDTQLQAQGDLRFADADSSNWVAFQAPSTVATDITWTLPNADGTNGQALSTNGSGTLSWTTPFISISDNTSDAGTNYITLTTATSGTITAARVTSTRLTFQPSTGTVTTSLMVVNGNATSSGTGSGSIIVTGGVGISGNMFAGGTTNDVKGETRLIPVNAQGTYTLVVADHGKMISATGTITVPSGVFSAGQNISVYNNTGGNITVAQGGGVTLRQVATSNTGNRTLAQRGFVAIICVASNEFVISGGGLT